MTTIEDLVAVEVPLGLIEPWGNDRKEFDAEELKQLATSMANNGLAQPITLRPRPDGAGYWLVAGGGGPRCRSGGRRSRRSSGI
jgi:ParB family chromosome partitioning protein